MNYWGLLVPAALLVTLMIVAFVKRGAGGVGDGFRETGSLLGKVAPNLIIGFTLAGFLTMLLPQDLVVRWMGAGSGWKGLLVGSAAGTLTPGGPFTHFPILASLLTRGAAVGPVCAYIAAWAMLGVHRILVWESPILGWKFVAIRFVSSFFVPPIVGFLAQLLADLWKFVPQGAPPTAP